ncbi:MAG: hypothetical protein ACYS21_20060 [Planctomycetota bacterium]
MKLRRAIICMIVPIALAALWFLGVDKSWFVEECHDCRYQCDVIQYRLFSLPLHERKTEHHPPIELVARDLGAPCPHQHFHRWHKHRCWGLCCCAWPRIDGITRLSGGPWYDRQLSAKVKAAAAADPTLAEDFRRRVVYGHDWNYWRRFTRELRDDNLQRIVLSAGNLPEDTLREIVNRIDHIEWLEPKQARPQPDENAAVVLALDKSDGPFLDENVADELPSISCR